MEVYPNSALVAPIIPANQQLQTAAQTAALQQRSALEAQQTQGAALANQEAQLALKDQQKFDSWMMGNNNTSTNVANDLNNTSGAPSQATAPQTSIPPALAPNTDQSQALQPGAIGLTTTGAPANTAALAPQIPPMLARVAPNQGAAPSLGQQASAPIQAATAPISTQPHPLAGLPFTSGDYAARIQGAMNDPEIRPTYKFALQQKLVGMAKAQADLAQSQDKATQEQQAVQQGYRDDLLRYTNAYLNGGVPWDQVRNGAISEGIPGADKWPTQDPGINAVVGMQHGLRTTAAEQKYLSEDFQKQTQDGLSLAAQTADNINQDGTNYPAWRANQVRQNWTLDRTLPQTYQGPQTITQIKQLPLSAQDRLKAPGDIAQSDEAITKAAAQDLSNVKTPEDLAAWNARYPRIFNPPKTVAEIPAFQLRAVPIKEQPAYNIEKKSEAQIAQMTPTDWDQQIKIASGGDQGLADRTKALVSAAIAGGDLKGARAAVKDAADQVGRVQVAKEEAKNRVTINGIGTGPNGEPSATAQMVADYQIPFSQAASRLPAKDRDILNTQVRKLNPQFQASNFNTFQSTERAFTSGEPANKVRALNTMMGHLSTLDQAATLLDNGNLPALNKIANFWGVQSGKDPVTTFNAIVHRIGPEVTNAYIASGGTSAERGTNEQDFNANLGAKQIKSNIGVAAQLAGSLVNGLQDQYQRGTYGRGTQKLLTDEADGARQRLTAQSPVRTNTVTMDQVNAYAKKHNITPAASRLKAESEGFTVK